MIYDVAVIGGGIIGMMTAYELAREKLDVILLDSQESGKACSWAGGGILSSLRPWLENQANLDLCQWGERYYPDFCGLLHQETGIDPEYIRSGLLILDCKDSEDIRYWIANGKEQSVWITEGENFDSLHAWFPRPKPSIWLPEVAQVRNPRLLRALKTLLSKMSVKMIEHCPVYEIDTRSDTQFMKCLTHIETIKAAHVVLSAGVWSNDLLPESCALDLIPIRGQMLCITDHQIELDHIVINENCYLIPRKTDAILIGSTTENVGFDNGVTQSAREHFIQSASQLIPEINKTGMIHHWSGLRPKSGKGHPYIGKVPGHDRLLVNTGHYRTGLLTAAASARIVCDCILGRDCLFDVTAYLPG